MKKANLIKLAAIAVSVTLLLQLVLPMQIAANYVAEESCCSIDYISVRLGESKIVYRGDGYTVIRILSKTVEHVDEIVQREIRCCDRPNWIIAGESSFHTIREYPLPRMCVEGEWFTQWMCFSCRASDTRHRISGGCGTGCPVLN